MVVWGDFLGLWCVDVIIGGLNLYICLCVLVVLYIVFYIWGNFVCVGYLFFVFELVVIVLKFWKYWII